MNALYDIIGVPFGYLMRLIYSICNNYAVAIILFTVITKILLLPVNYKTQKGAARMQLLNPKLEKLKKSFANNPQRLQEEQQKLYQQEGVNPMGSCLPAFIQMFLLFGVIDVIYKPVTHILDISKSIIDERNENGEYKSFTDAVTRMYEKGCNKIAFEALILCGAFDSFVGNRNQKLYMYQKIIETNTSKMKKSMPGEVSIFDIMEENGIATNVNKFSDEELLKEYDDIKDFSDEQKLFTEKDYTGIYLSGHPMQKYVSFVEKYVNAKSTSFVKDDDGNTDMEDGAKVSIVGIIDEIKKMKVKKTGDEMAKLVLSDFSGSFDVLAFHNKYVEYNSLIVKNNIVFIEGKLNIDERNERGSIYIDKMYNIDDYIELKKNSSMPPAVKIKVHFADKDTFIAKHTELYSILKSNSGKDFVEIILDKERQMKILKELPISFTNNLVSILKDNYGDEMVEVVNGK